MTSELVPLHLTFGELKRVAGLLGCRDATEIWVEHRSPSQLERPLLHSVPSTGVEFDPATAGYSRLIVTISRDYYFVDEGDASPALPTGLAR